MMQGSGYIGSDNIKISIANQEILPPPPTEWTMKYNFYKFSFMNDQECRVIINNGAPIYLRAAQGFEMNETDARITSFKIIESSITYNYLGAF